MNSSRPPSPEFAIDEIFSSFDDIPSPSFYSIDQLADFLNVDASTTTSPFELWDFSTHGHDGPPTLQQKIQHAFRKQCVGISQLWAPVETAGGRSLLTTNFQPFKLGMGHPNCYNGPNAYRSFSLGYEHNIDEDDLQAEEDDQSIISNGAPAKAFRNQLPELLVEFNQTSSPLEASALANGLVNSIMCPVFDPSQTGCVGVIECATTFSSDLLPVFNLLNDELENQGLVTFDARQRLPCRNICGLQNAKDEIDEALHRIWRMGSSRFDRLPFVQVWIPYPNENEAPHSSSLQNTRTIRRPLWHKLTGSVTLDNEYLVCLKDYSTACYRIPIEMEKDFTGMTNEIYQPRLIQNLSKSSENKLQKLLSTYFKCSSFVIYLKSTKTNDLVYMFEFLFKDHKDKVLLLESLLLELKMRLPSFKFATGMELDDEVDILDVQNSIESENKYFKIFQTKRKSLERGRPSRVEEDLRPMSTRGKTTPITLSLTQIESQFGKTLEEAASKLNVSLSTLKRKCKEKGIRWPGKDKGRAFDEDL